MGRINKKAAGTAITISGIFVLFTFVLLILLICVFTIPLTFHAEKDPTCAEVGHREYWENPIIKRYYGDKDGTEILDKSELKITELGHEIEIHEAKQPTCQEAGWEEYETCKRDGCKYTTYQEKPAFGSNSDLGHDIEIHEAKQPTCEVVGWEEYKTCKRDGCKYTTYQEKPSLGHELDSNGICKYCNLKKGITLSLDANGGEVSQTRIIAAAASKISLPIPQRTDFEFAGWVDNYTNQVVNYTVMPSINRTLTAKWVQTKFYFSKAEESAVHFKGIAGRAEVTLFESSNCNFDYAELLKLGYTKFNVKINFQMRDTNGCDDRMKFSIGNLYLEHITNVGRGLNWNSIEVEFKDKDLVHLDTTNIKLWLYGYRGDVGYTWLAGQHINIVITATK